MLKQLWWAIKNAYKGRYVQCADCESTFRECQLKEVHDGMEYVEAIVCPKCGSSAWDFVAPAK